MDKNVIWLLEDHLTKHDYQSLLPDPTRFRKSVSEQLFTYYNVCRNYSKEKINLIFSNAGISIQSYGRVKEKILIKNCIQEFHDLLNQTPHTNLFTTPIRIQSCTGTQLFTIKPKPWLKKSRDTHLESLILASDLIFKEVLPKINKLNLPIIVKELDVSEEPETQSDRADSS